MASTAVSADKALYEQLQYRVAGPLEHQIECLDVVTKPERRWLIRGWLPRMSSRSGFHLVKQGSLLSEDLMAAESNWRSADKAAMCDHIRDGLAELKNSRINRPADKEVFKKKKMHDVTLAWTTSKGASAWLQGFAGIDVGKKGNLFCTMEGLTSAAVDYPKIRSWINSGDWRPNLQTLQLCCDEWSQDRKSKIRSLWIVTEVLYATKLTVTRQVGVWSELNAQIPTGVPGVNAGADLTIRNVNGSVLELKAKRNRQFLVGYRTMRVDYDLDGKVRAVRAPEDTGLRGEDDDPYLKWMEEDIFEVDEEGDNVAIPLLTPTKDELNNLKLLIANESGDVEGSVSN